MSEVSEGRKRAYSSWRSMKERCYNPKTTRWDRYGGRGIAVCDRWRDDFEVFLADMGERPDGMTLDRIDGDGHYEPGNCRWATWEEQNQSHRKGGKRAGRKPIGEVAMSKMFRAPVTPDQSEQSKRLAAEAGMTVAEWLRSLVDRAIGEHECQECKAKGRKR